jgi:23S rRNA (cytidine1920-2'-O)/16S rRNA (cytidine1409-2'-O)-methyltransferase
MSERLRIDVALVERGLVHSRELARRMIMAGEVTVEDRWWICPAPRSRRTRHRSEGRAPFVSRGGEKLAAALAAFPVEVEGRLCADVGASTGGFTDCLLQRGAIRVYAIDVGYGQLDYRLRQDGRVVVMERTNARYLKMLPEAVTLATVDASFISLKLLLPVIRGWFGGQRPCFL